MALLYYYDLSTTNELNIKLKNVCFCNKKKWNRTGIKNINRIYLENESSLPVEWGDAFGMLFGTWIAVEVGGVNCGGAAAVG